MPLKAGFSEVDKATEIEERLIDFAVRIIKVANALSKLRERKHKAGQLLHCQGYLFCSCGKTVRRIFIISYLSFLMCHWKA